MSGAGVHGGLRDTVVHIRIGGFLPPSAGGGRSAEADCKVFWNAPASASSGAFSETGTRRSRPGSRFQGPPHLTGVRPRFPSSGRPLGEPLPVSADRRAGFPGAMEEVPHLTVQPSHLDPLLRSVPREQVLCQGTVPIPHQIILTSPESICPVSPGPLCSVQSRL